jgi:hypothetical protein
VLTLTLTLTLSTQVQVPLWSTLHVDLGWNMGVPVREIAEP